MRLEWSIISQQHRLVLGYDWLSSAQWHSKSVKCSPNLCSKFTCHFCSVILPKTLIPVAYIANHYHCCSCYVDFLDEIWQQQNMRKLLQCLQHLIGAKNVIIFFRFFVRILFYFTTMPKVYLRWWHRRQGVSSLNLLLNLLQN